MAIHDILPCPCGSGKDSWWEKDAQNIPLTRVCVDCAQAKLAKYEPRIFTGYTQADVDEFIDEDKY